MSNLIANVTLDIAGSAQEQGLMGAENYSKEDAGLGVMIGNLMSALMMAGALACFLFIVWGAIEWLTSGGDSSKVESAKNKISNAVIGLLILSATTAIFTLLQEFLGIDFISFN